MSILRTVLNEDDPDHHAALIERLCGSQPDLRREVESLLAADENTGPNLDRPIQLTQEVNAETDELIGAQLGPFLVQETIGRGGMGTVYRAEREIDGTQQQVAIKVIRRGLDSDDILARFLRERRILAALSHPNLTRLIDGGRTPDGRPWLALDYVQGEPITDWCDRNRLDPRARIQLLLQVADAVQHAHERLVVHRDIKPGNVLVDRDGHVRLLDFGIAKLVDPEHADHTRLSGNDAPAMLTPEYAAPEQLAGAAITAATDVYALGVLLYQLLSGRLPHTFAQREWRAIQREVLETQPPRLSQAITERLSGDSTQAQRGLQERSISLTAFRRLARGDLDRVLGKALAKEPERRYASVQAFSDDLRRFLAGQPVAVTGSNWRYRAGKFIARNRAGVALATLSLILLIAGIGGITWQAAKTQQEAQRALAESARATAVKNFLGDLLTSASPQVNPGQTPTVRQLMDDAARRVDTEFADRPELAAELLALIGSSYRGLGEMTAAETVLESAMNLVERNELDPQLTAAIQGEFIRVLIGRSDLEAAVDLAETSLANLPDDANLRLPRSMILNSQATALRLLGQAERALAAQDEAIELACAVPGAERQCLTSQIELKYFLELVGDQARALDAASMAWRTAEAMFPGQPHPLRLNAIWSYGDMLSMHRQPERAIALLGEGVDLAREIYGEGNFRYARALDMLAVANQDIGNLPEALALTEQAFTIGGRAVPRNPMTAFWLQRIVSILIELHEPERAATALSERWHELPEQLPRPTGDMFEILRLRLRLYEPALDLVAFQADANALAERLETQSSTLLPRALAIAIEGKLRAGDLSGAQQDRDRLQLTIDSDPSPDSSFALARRLLGHAMDARIALALRQFADAGQALDSAEQVLATLSMPANPWQAEIWLLRADAHCLGGDSRAAGDQYRRTLRYWRENLQTRFRPLADDAAIRDCRAQGLSMSSQ